jgi:hypothetical protein
MRSVLTRRLTARPAVTVIFVAAVAATAAIVALPDGKTTADRVADWLIETDACWGVEQGTGAAVRPTAANQEPPLAARARSRTTLDCLVFNDGQGGATVWRFATSADRVAGLSRPGHGAMWVCALDHEVVHMFVYRTPPTGPRELCRRLNGSYRRVPARI